MTFMISISLLTLGLVCTKLDALIDAGTPPDLVLDLTKIGIASEMVKSISLTLALPTVSSSFGEEGDIA